LFRREAREAGLGTVLSVSGERKRGREGDGERGLILEVKKGRNRQEKKTSRDEGTGRELGYLGVEWTR